MDADTFIAKFSTFVGAPGGAQLLRDLVLGLAVEGVLSAAEDRDDPAEALLAATGIKARASTGLYCARWAVVRLGDIADVRLGRQRSPAKAQGERMRPYLRAANVRWDGLHLGEVKEMAFTEEESRIYELQPGDLLLGEASGSLTEVGKPAQYRGEIPGCCFQNTLIRVRLREDLALSADFYEMYFRQQARSGRFAASSRGMGINHLGARTLVDWAVPVPPHAEQQRIVTKTRELMTLVDELETRQEQHRLVASRFQGSALHALAAATDTTALRGAWDRVSRNWGSLTDHPAGVTVLRQSILRLAVSGHLVPHDPSAEPAQVLLDRLAERRSAPAAALPPDDRPPLPPGWSWASFGQATINRDADRIPLKRADRAQRPGDYVYYGASGPIDMIDDYIFDGDYLLIGEDGANLVLRSTPIAFIATGRFWVNNHAHVVECAELDALKYLSLYLNAIDLRPYLTGIAQPKLNQARLNRIPVPLPPLAEQRRIVSAAERLLAICEQLEQSLGCEQTRRRDLAIAACHSMIGPPTV